MTDAPQVDTHDPAGFAAFLRERAKANREIAGLPFDEWPHRPDVLRHWALRFDQGAALIERLALQRAESITSNERLRLQLWLKHAEDERDSKILVVDWAATFANALAKLPDETGGRLFWHPECASCKAGHVPCEHGRHAGCPECNAQKTPAPSDGDES